MSNPIDPDLAEALSSARRLVSADPRDWTADRHDAFLYGLFRGWDDPADEERVARQHQWDAAYLDRLHRLHAAVNAAIEAG